MAILDRTIIKDTLHLMGTTEYTGNTYKTLFLKVGYAGYTALRYDSSLHFGNTDIDSNYNGNKIIIKSKSNTSIECVSLESISETMALRSSPYKDEDGNTLYNNNITGYSEGILIKSNKNINIDSSETFILASSKLGEIKAATLSVNTTNTSMYSSNLLNLVSGSNIQLNSTNNIISNSKYYKITTITDGIDARITMGIEVINDNTVSHNGILLTSTDSIYIQATNICQLSGDNLVLKSNTNFDIKSKVLNLYSSPYTDANGNTLYNNNITGNDDGIKINSNNDVTIRSVNRVISLIAENALYQSIDSSKILLSATGIDLNSSNHLYLKSIDTFELTSSSSGVSKIATTLGSLLIESKDSTTIQSTSGNILINCKNNEINTTISTNINSDGRIIINSPYNNLCTSGANSICWVLMGDEIYRDYGSMKNGMHIYSNDNLWIRGVNNCSISGGNTSIKLSSNDITLNGTGSLAVNNFDKIDINSTNETNINSDGNMAIRSSRTYLHTVAANSICDVLMGDNVYMDGGSSKNGMFIFSDDNLLIRGANNCSMSGGNTSIDLSSDSITISGYALNKTGSLITTNLDKIDLNSNNDFNINTEGLLNLSGPDIRLNSSDSIYFVATKTSIESILIGKKDKLYGTSLPTSDLYDGRVFFKLI